MNIIEATNRACKEDTLLDALAFICLWESERIVKQAVKAIANDTRNVDGTRWDTCFKWCIDSVMKQWEINQTIKKGMLRMKCNRCQIKSKLLITCKTSHFGYCPACAAVLLDEREKLLDLLHELHCKVSNFLS